MLTAHFPISGNAELSSNKYQFLNKQSPITRNTFCLFPLKLYEKYAIGLGITHWRLNFISLVILFPQKSMELLASQAKTKNILRSASCSNPGCHLLDDSLFYNCNMGRTIEPPRSSCGIFTQYMRHYGDYCLVSS